MARRATGLLNLPGRPQGSWARAGWYWQQQRQLGGHVEALAMPEEHAQQLAGHQPVRGNTTQISGGLQAQLVQVCTSCRIWPAPHPCGDATPDQQPRRAQLQPALHDVQQQPIDCSALEPRIAVSRPAAIGLRCPYTGIMPKK